MEHQSFETQLKRWWWAREAKKLRMKTAEDRIRQTQAEYERNLRNLHKVAGKQIAFTPEPPMPTNAFRLGMYVDGTPPRLGISVRDNWVQIDSTHMLEHLLVMGSTGSGKSEFLLRLAHEILFSPEDLDLYVVDGKGDPEFAKRIAVMAHHAGKGPVPIMKLGWGDGSPTAVFDGLAHGDAEAVYERLLAIFSLDSTRETESEFFRARRRVIFQLICGVNTDLQYGVEVSEPPRDLAELEERFTLQWLRATYATSPKALAKIADAEKDFKGFDSQLAEPLNPLYRLIGKGGFKLGDARVVVFSLNAEAMSFNSERLFSFIGESIRSYISTQPTGRLQRKTYWIIDEFSSFRPKTLEGIINQARSKRMSVTLAMLHAASLGEDDKVRESIKGCKTHLIFQHEDALEIIRRTGTKFVPDTTIRTEEGSEKGISIGQRETYKIDAEVVRSLEPGYCFISSRGSPVQMLVSQLDKYHEHEFDERTMENTKIRSDILKSKLKPTPTEEHIPPPSPELPRSNQPTPF